MISKYWFGFTNLNLENIIKINVKAKFQMSQNGEFLHFSRILHRSTKFCKYASIEGVRILVTPLFLRHLGTKKALVKSAFFAISRA